MVGKLRELWPVKRVVALAVGFWDTFLRDNKVVPPVLAVAALFVFAWIVFGSFIGAPEDEPVSSQDEIAQSEGDGGSQPPAPEVENPNTDSYAAYQSKDPFRQLFQTPESTTQQEDTVEEDTDATDDGSEDPADGEDGGGGGSGGSQDTDGDDDTSQGNPGATDEQYDNDDDADDSQSPRQDPTDGTDDTDDTGSQTPNPQTPAQPNRPADPGDGLFDSGGDLERPNRR